MARSNHISCHRVGLFNWLRQQLRPDWRRTGATDLSKQIRTTLHCAVFCSDGIGGNMCDFNADYLVDHEIHGKRDAADKASEDGCRPTRRDGFGRCRRQGFKTEGLGSLMLSHLNSKNILLFLLHKTENQSKDPDDPPGLITIALVGGNWASWTKSTKSNGADRNRRDNYSSPIALMVIWNKINTVDFYDCQVLDNSDQIPLRISHRAGASNCRSTNIREKPLPGKARLCFQPSSQCHDKTCMVWTLERIRIASFRRRQFFTTAHDDLTA